MATKKNEIINTPLERAIENEIDRFSLAIDAIDRVPKLQVRGRSSSRAELLPPGPGLTRFLTPACETHGLFQQPRWLCSTCRQQEWTATR